MVLGASGSGKSSLVRAGLVHKLQIGILTSGSWHIFKIYDSNQPYINWIDTLLSDNQGGIWAGTREGLVHFKKDGSWQVFNTDNSNLPYNWIYPTFRT